MRITVSPPLLTHEQVLARSSRIFSKKKTLKIIPFLSVIKWVLFHPAHGAAIHINYRVDQRISLNGPKNRNVAVLIKWMRSRSIQELSKMLPRSLVIHCRLERTLCNFQFDSILSVTHVKVTFKFLINLFQTNTAFTVSLQHLSAPYRDHRLLLILFNCAVICEICFLPAAQ